MSLNILNSHFILLPIVVRIAILENVDFIRNSPPPKKNKNPRFLFCTFVIVFESCVDIFEPLLIIYIC